MIVTGLFNVIYSLFSFLTALIEIPKLPAGVDESLLTFFEAIEMGVQILSAFTHLNYLLTLFGIIVAIDLGIVMYKMIMWVLRKIPMAGIS